MHRSFRAIALCAPHWGCLAPDWRSAEPNAAQRACDAVHFCSRGFRCGGRMPGAPRCAAAARGAPPCYVRLAGSISDTYAARGRAGRREPRAFSVAWRWLLRSPPCDRPRPARFRAHTAHTQRKFRTAGFGVPRGVHTSPRLPPAQGCGGGGHLCVHPPYLVAGLLGVHYRVWAAPQDDERKRPPHE